jgi:alpha/beta superfamily hydrolase
VNPLYFGDPVSPLYGVYHMPETSTSLEIGAVLCPPVLSEYTKARRAMRALAERLAKAGVHVLRFDYHGTGDSAGDGLDCQMERWIADTAAAVSELKASRGLRSVGLVGLRFGATLAMLTAERSGDAPFLVLWEPIVSGREYVHELRTQQDRWVQLEAAQQPTAGALARSDEILGSPFPPELEEGFLGVDLCQAKATPAKRVFVVSEGATRHFHALGRRLAETGALADTKRLDGGQIWNQELYSEKAQVPREVIAAIVDWIVKGDT